MKGIESMPLKYLLVSVIIAIVLGVGFWQMDYFLNFKLNKDFKEDITSLAQTIKTLRSSGDYNSFTTVKLTIPSKYEFKINVATDVLNGTMIDEIFDPSLPENITAVRFEGTLYKDVDGSVIFNSGTVYDLTLFYGDIKDEQIRDMTIVFK